ncbi:MAG: ribose 5-phosphate isomerase B [Pirellulaceae bacterium]|nr:ribose 5-phosphate isomerase B [Pirellulaceae bacterium]
MTKWACQRCVIGGDHAGYSMKVQVEKFLHDAGIPMKDCGAFNEQPSDFPDFAELVAEEILSGRADRGILVCGSGVGVSVAANKIPGIRASLCHDTYSAHQGVEHDDMNVLCIGARVIGPELAFEIMRSFLSAVYAPQPRHLQRVAKILEIERKALRGDYTAKR